jgi:hypothetical protein
MTTTKTVHLCVFILNVMSMYLIQLLRISNAMVVLKIGHSERVLMTTGFVYSTLRRTYIA